MVTDNIALCTGCGVCSVVCPKKCISINLNDEGFYIPKLSNAAQCIHCGLCDRVCPKDAQQAEQVPLQLIAVASNTKEVLQSTSSGGICYELAKQAIKEGKKTCACIYNYQENRAEHAVVQSVEELELTKGSKYFQSYTADAFEKVLDGEDWAVFGTPCQIAAIDKAARLKNCRDKLLLVDFFCHGTPSINLWKKYLSEQGEQGLEKIDFRSKEFGWHSWSLRFHYKDGKSHTDHNRNMFYKFFFSNLCLNESCYRCHFKAFKSAADIRVGDFWGKKYAEDRDGVSSCVILTPKGQAAMDAIGENCMVTPVEKPDVMEVQMSESPVKHAREYKRVMKALKSRQRLSSIYNTTLFSFRSKGIIKALLRRR